MVAKAVLQFSFRKLQSRWRFKTSKKDKEYFTTNYGRYYWKTMMC